METAANGAEALAKLAASSFDLVFSDYNLPGMKGDELFRKIKAEHPELPVVIASGTDNLKKLFPADTTILAKPFDLNQLKGAIHEKLPDKAMKAPTPGPYRQTVTVGSKTFEILFPDVEDTTSFSQAFRVKLDKTTRALAAVTGKLLAKEMAAGLDNGIRQVSVKHVSSAENSKVFQIQWGGRVYILKKTTHADGNPYLQNQWNILQRLNADGNDPDIAQPLLFGSQAAKDSQGRPFQSRYLITDYGHGETLAHRLIDDEKLTAHEVAEYGISLARVVQRIHEQGIIIRDLRPENIILQDDGHVYLFDFDLSIPHGYNWVEDPDGLRNLLQDQFVDSTWNKDPLAAVQGPGVLADIYSIGKNLYFAASREARNGPLKDIVAKAIGPREERYPTAAALAADLKKLKAPLANATKTEEKPGGIDFNAKNLHIKEEGRAPDLQWENVPAIDPASLRGITPIIINITPVNNFPLLLGLAEETPPQQLSALN